MKRNQPQSCSQSRLRAYLAIPSLIIGACLASSPAAAAEPSEISLLQGFYKSERNKGGLVNHQLSLGGRFSQQFDPRMYWFGEAELASRNFSADTGYAPRDAMNVKLGGGLRYYFERFGERLAPYGALSAHVRNERDASSGGNLVTEIDRQGLFYGAGVGLRLSFDARFFLDLEAPLFSSALYAKETTRRVPRDGNGPTITAVTSRYELYGASTGSLGQVQVALGLRL